MDVRFVPFEEIDVTRWNSCIHFAINGNVFGYHWFLKNVSREFDALVEGNYESVMPLISRASRWNYPQLFHPNEIGRLGIFSVHVLSPPRIQKFIDSIPDTFLGQQISFNEYNKSVIKDMPDTKSSPWYQLDLSPPYEIIQSGYHAEVLNQIEDSRDQNWMPHSHIKPEELVEFFASIDSDTDTHMWMRIHYNLMHRGTAFPTVYANSDGEIGAAALFTYYNGFFTLLNFKAKPNLEKPLFYLMSDDLIRLHADRALRFDFNLFGEDFHADKLGAIKKDVYRIDTTPKWGKIFRHWMGQ